MAKPSHCRPDSKTGGALLLTDPQTSGGLLVACDAEAAPAILGRASGRAIRSAAIVGSVGGRARPNRGASRAAEPARVIQA